MLLGVCVGVCELFLQKIFSLSPADALHIDVTAQTITIEKTGERESFELNPYKKTCLLNGYDDIDFLISRKSAIEQFESAKA